MDFLFDGLMIEVHPNPDLAKTDGKQQITPSYYGRMIKKLQLSFADPLIGHQLQKISLLRNEIDVIDDNLISLLGKRMEYVKEIGVWKRDQNISLLQLERWKKILFTRLRKSEEIHLSRQFMRAIFELIHEEALRVQEEIKAPAAPNVR